MSKKRNTTAETAGSGLAVLVPLGTPVGGPRAFESVGGPGGGRQAVRVAMERQWSNYRRDQVLDTRDMKVALRALRSLSREGQLELDIDETISETARQGGEIELVERKARVNRVHLVLLMDAGGSMTPHSQRVNQLFSAAHQVRVFKSFKAYYFHNCVYNWLYNDISQLDRVATSSVLENIGPNHRVIFVGDASMAPYELFSPYGWYQDDKSSGLEWLQRFRSRSRSAVWLNPDPRRYWQHPTVSAIGNLFPMVELSVEVEQSGTPFTLADAYLNRLIRAIFLKLHLNSRPLYAALCAACAFLLRPEALRFDSVGIQGLANALVFVGASTSGKSPGFDPGIRRFKSYRPSHSPPSGVVVFGEITLFTGNANPALAEKICQRLGIPLGEARVGRFSDGEIRVEIEQNVRGRDVFLIQPTCSPSNDNLMELLIMAEACKRSSAGRITAVMPYFGYARQDRKVQPRAPITAKLVADLIQAAGIGRVLTMDLHAGQIQGFFDIPVDNLYAQPLLYRFLRSRWSMMRP